jgi:hypothetical protein
VGTDSNAPTYTNCHTSPHAATADGDVAATANTCANTATTTNGSANATTTNGSANATTTDTCTNSTASDC